MYWPEAPWFFAADGPTRLEQPPFDKAALEANLTYYTRKAYEWVRTAALRVDAGEDLVNKWLKVRGSNFTMHQVKVHLRLIMDVLRDGLLLYRLGRDCPTLGRGTGIRGFIFPMLGQAETPQEVNQRHFGEMVGNRSVIYWCETVWAPDKLQGNWPGYDLTDESVVETILVGGIVHEVSHHFGTTDVDHGQWYCQLEDCSKLEPSKAQMNTDSYRILVEDLFNHSHLPNTSEFVDAPPFVDAQGRNPHESCVEGNCELEHLKDLAKEWFEDEAAPDFAPYSEDDLVEVFVSMWRNQCPQTCSP